MRPSTRRRTRTGGALLRRRDRRHRFPQSSIEEERARAIADPRELSSESRRSKSRQPHAERPQTARAIRETVTLVVRAFPPVAVLLVLTAPALQPRADLVASLARLHCLGVAGWTAFAICIRSEPACNNWSLRVGRSGKLEDEAERGQRERAPGLPRQSLAENTSLGGGVLTLRGPAPGGQSRSTNTRR